MLELLSSGSIPRSFTRATNLAPVLESDLIFSRISCLLKIRSLTTHRKFSGRLAITSSAKSLSDFVPSVINTIPYLPYFFDFSSYHKLPGETRLPTQFRAYTEFCVTQKFQLNNFRSLESVKRFLRLKRFFGQE